MNYDYFVAARVTQLIESVGFMAKESCSNSWEGLEVFLFSKVPTPSLGAYPAFC
jgi:hypothetical protein